MITTREAWLTRGPSTPHGTLGDIRTDNGYTGKTVERPWVDNLQGVSSIPKGRWMMVWKWSEKHQKFLYHAVAVPGRDEIELHSANVFEQLLGCVAFGTAVATFQAGSIHPGVPSVAMEGVTESVLAMDKFHAHMRDADGKQAPFWLNIS